MIPAPVQSKCSRMVKRALCTRRALSKLVCRTELSIARGLELLEAHLFPSITYEGRMVAREGKRRRREDNRRFPRVSRLRRQWHESEHGAQDNHPEKRCQEGRSLRNARFRRLQ